MICVYDKGSFIILTTFNFSFTTKAFYIFKMKPQYKLNFSE